MSTAVIDLDREAETILRANDRGRFSVPTKGLYPFQWNWDSAFAALGYAHLDPLRAVAELETLAASQWADGMIPHIIFHEPDEGYFPGPKVWGSGRTPPTSGITQPPVFAIALEKLAARGIVDGARLAPLVEAAARWHAWFFTARRDPATNAIGVVHPWESGRDNMPDWDSSLAAVSTEGIAPFERRDLDHVDAAARPTKEQYERYIALVEFGRELDWDQDELAKTSPFFVGDPGLHAILMRAERSLITLAADRTPDIAEAARERLQALGEGLEALWCERLGAYSTLDVRSGNRGGGVSSAAFLAFGAAAPLREDRAGSLLSHFDRLAERCRYMVPSYDPAAEVFDERRYWRGPVWLVVNWLIAEGLADAGHHERATRVRSDSRALVQRSGFYEYFSPLSGAALGGGDFTWTAAAWLDFARE